MGIATLFSGLPAEWNYLLRIAAVSIFMGWAWRWYVPFKGPKNISLSVIYGVLVGIVGTVLWIVALVPFVDESATASNGFSFSLKLLAATLLVPIFEELFIRVYLFRIAYQWFNEKKLNKNALEDVMHNKSIDAVRPGEWNYFAVIFSTIAFALGHQVVEWPAALLYGLMMASLWIVRKDIISCIVAHGTTNLALGLYVYRTQSWGLW